MKRCAVHHGKGWAPKISGAQVWSGRKKKDPRMKMCEAAYARYVKAKCG